MCQKKCTARCQKENWTALNANFWIFSNSVKKTSLKRLLNREFKRLLKNTLQQWLNKTPQNFVQKLQILGQSLKTNCFLQQVTNIAHSSAKRRDQFQSSLTAVVKFDAKLSRVINNWRSWKIFGTFFEQFVCWFFLFWINRLHYLSTRNLG